ncbi:MAG: LysR family transcriptional regulator [Rhodoferax sp.]|nr:LysR family transcriptional regulator [Rhodoferax sp.]
MYFRVKHKRLIRKLYKPEMPDTLPSDPHGVLALDYLRAFIAVAKAGSVVRGAESVYKAPSAVTRSLLELERMLGPALFERKPRGMLINDYGDAVLLRSLRIQDEVNAAVDEFSRSSTPSTSLRNALVSLLFNGRKLQLLIYLSDHRNISAAATQLGMSQAGASMSLSRIEGALGQALFQRMLQGMVATDAAAKLVIRAKRIFSELRHMEADIAAISGNLAGSVAIGTLPLGRTFVVPTGIAKALALHPGLRVVTIESHYEQLIGNLRSGDIDVVFGALRSRDVSQGLISEPLFEDRMGIIARAGHPFTRHNSLALSDLLSEKWILPRPNAPGRRLVDVSFQELGLQAPVPSVETGDLAMLRQLLISSDMLTAISPHQLLFEIESGTLTELPVRIGATTRSIGFTMREGSVMSPATMAVLDAIREQAKALANGAMHNSIP